MSTIASMLVSMGLDGSDVATGARTVTNSLGTIQDEVADTESAFSGLGGTLADFGKTAGLAAGGALVGGLLTAVSTDTINDQLAAQLDLSAAESERIGGVAGELYANAYGDSLEQVNDAVAAVMSSIDGMSTASSAELQGVTAKALDFAKVFGVDVAQAASYAGVQLSTGLARDAEHAFDLITAASQRVPVALREDVLEAGDEYGQFFHSLGFTGEQAFGLLVDAAAKGTYEIDKTGDAIKEFSIRATDMSTTSVDAYKAIGLNAEQMAGAILAGGDTAQGAFQQIIGGLLSMQDPTERANTAIALFGTPLEDLSTGEIPQFLQAMAGVGAGLGDVAGAADRMGQTLNDNASTNLQSFWRQTKTAFVDIVGGRALPALESMSAFLATNFGPALDTTAAILTGTVIPAAQDTARWIGENRVPIGIVAGLIAAVFIPHFIALGVTATVTKVKVVAAWVATQAGAIRAAAVHSAQVLMMIARWAAMAAAATGNALLVGGAYAVIAGGAVSSAATTASVWAVAQLRTLASLVAMAAGFVAQGAAMVASAAVTAAGVVGSWVLMGVQSLLQAARMALAWVIAMGPVGWVIAAIVALVALIIANWDTVVAWTTKAWDWVFSKAIKPAIDLVVGYVRWWINNVLTTVDFLRALPGRVGGFFLSMHHAIVDKATQAIGFVRSIPGRILDALGSLKDLLVGAGGDVIDGLWRGIQRASGWLRDKIMALVREVIPGPVRQVLGISSPSKVMAAIGRWVPPGIALGIDSTAALAVRAAENLAHRVTTAMSGLGASVGMPALAFAGSTPRMPTAASASTGGPGGDDPGWRQRATVYIENYHPPADASAHDVAEDLDWFARGGG